MLSSQQTQKAGNWIKDNFSEQINEQTKGTIWTLSDVQAIFCKETANRVLLWIDDYEPDVILQRCVFDASGDFPGTTRNAFPRNKKDFDAIYRNGLSDILITEANKMRKMPQPGKPQGYTTGSYLYKGYGLFQYDLQNIMIDRAFFEDKLWYSFDECLSRLIKILNNKARQAHNLHGIFMAYNGAGSKANEYANDVLNYKQQFLA